MKSLAIRFSWVGLTLVLGACNSGDHAARLPTAPGRVPGTAAAPASQLATASGGPEGFFASFRVKPQPGLDGVIRGSSPLPIEFDLCGSRADAGKDLVFLFDWDFDHVPDVQGTNDTCLQTHTFNGAQSPDGSFEANVCMANGDLHSPGTYTTCRVYHISVSSFPESSCIHSRCAQGPPMVAGCNDCVSAICAVDPFCCNVLWDSICV